MLKFLSNLTATGPQLPYDIIGEAKPTKAWGNWEHFDGKSKEGEEPVSIFKFTAASADDPALTGARNGLKRLRLVRHPNVLAYKDSLEFENGEKSGGPPVVYLVTEQVQTLADKLEELQLEGTERDQFLAWGTQAILKAVSFLNNDCRMIHGHVCAARVMVTKQLDWKMSGFDLLTEYDQADAPDAPLALLCGSVAAQYKPEELRKSDFALIKKSPPWAVDAWGLGCLLQEVFSGTALSSTDQLRDTEGIPKLVLRDYQRLLGSNPNRRLNCEKMIDSNEYFQNKLQEMISFLENLGLKDSTEKEAFFRKLPSSIETMSGVIAQKKMLPLLMHALEYASAPASALTPLLQIGNKLPSDEFDQVVVPCITKLFSSTDRGIRIGLLQNIHTFSEHLSTQVMDDQVFPNVCSGFTDSTAYLRELTLKSMLHIAPKLSQKNINQNLLKHLSKLQVDEESAIRANTTIALGNLARHFSAATCKRVLLNAFTRALKDAFAPARSAGVMALMATVQHYDAEEAAQRIIPAVGPLCIDMDEEVRTNSLKCLEVFVKVLQQHSERVAKGGDEKAQLEATKDSSSAASSILSWAVTSLKSRMEKPKGEASPGGEKSKGGEGSPDKAAGSSAAAAAEARPARPAPAPARPAAKPSPTPEDPEEDLAGDGDGDGDGWGDDDDVLEDEEAAAAAEEAALRARMTSARSLPARPSTSASTSRTPPPCSRGLRTQSDSAGGESPEEEGAWGAADEEDDGDGDGWGDMDDELPPEPAPAPAPKPAPRPAPKPAASRPAGAADGARLAARSRSTGALDPKAKSAAAGEKKPAASKLGATKLAAKPKLGASSLKKDDFDWDSFMEN